MTSPSVDTAAHARPRRDRERERRVTQEGMTGVREREGNAGKNKRGIRRTCGRELNALDTDFWLSFSTAHVACENYEIISCSLFVT